LKQTAKYIVVINLIVVVVFDNNINLSISYNITIILLLNLLIITSYSNILLYNLLLLRSFDSISLAIKTLTKTIISNEIIIYNNSLTYNCIFTIAKEY